MLACVFCVAIDLAGRRAKALDRRAACTGRPHRVDLLASRLKHRCPVSASKSNQAFALTDCLFLGLLGRQQRDMTRSQAGPTSEAFFARPCTSHSM